VAIGKPGASLTACESRFSACGKAPSWYSEAPANCSTSGLLGANWTSGAAISRAFLKSLSMYASWASSMRDSGRSASDFFISATC